MLLHLKIDGEDREVDQDRIFLADRDAVVRLMAEIGGSLACALLEHERAAAHRTAWRSRAIVAESDRHKAWPEWRVKAAVEADPEWLRLSEGVAVSGYNVMVLQGVRDAAMARLAFAGWPDHVAGASRPAFPTPPR
jgi:hypothetical protein